MVENRSWVFFNDHSRACQQAYPPCSVLCSIFNDFSLDFLIIVLFCPFLVFLVFQCCFPWRHLLLQSRFVTFVQLWPAILRTTHFFSASVVNSKIFGRLGWQSIVSCSIILFVVPWRIARTGSPWSYRFNGHKVQILRVFFSFYFCILLLFSRRVISRELLMRIQLFALFFRWKT